MKTMNSIMGMMFAVVVTVGQSMDSGINEYNQVLRMVVDGRAVIEAGQPDDYTWTCLDAVEPCVVRK